MRDNYSDSCSVSLSAARAFLCYSHREENITNKQGENKEVGSRTNGAPRLSLLTHGVEHRSGMKPHVAGGELAHVHRARRVGHHLALGVEHSLGAARCVAAQEDDAEYKHTLKTYSYKQPVNLV